MLLLLLYCAIVMMFCLPCVVYGVWLVVNTLLSSICFCNNNHFLFILPKG